MKEHCLKSSVAMPLRSGQMFGGVVPQVGGCWGVRGCINVTDRSITRTLHRSKETNNPAYKLTTDKLQPRCYNVLTSILKKLKVLPVSHCVSVATCLR